jgi:hypothetical protein
MNFLQDLSNIRPKTSFEFRVQYFLYWSTLVSCENLYFECTNSRVFELIIDYSRFILFFFEIDFEVFYFFILVCWYWFYYNLNLWKLFSDWPLEINCKCLVLILIMFSCRTVIMAVYTIIRLILKCNLPVLNRYHDLPIYKLIKLLVSYKLMFITVLLLCI